MKKLDIYGGLLGAGKTTLIKKMLAAAYSGSRAAIIENEIGKVNLDAQEFADIQIRPLTAGCVCCTLKGNMVAAVRELLQTENPDYIIIEATGAADLQAIREICAHIAEIRLNRCIMLVNAKKVRALLKVVGEFYHMQLRQADTIYLNFTETLSEEEIRGTEAFLLAINPKARIVSVPLDEITGDTFPDRPEPSDCAEETEEAEPLTRAEGSDEAKLLARTEGVREANSSGRVEGSEEPKSSVRAEGSGEAKPSVRAEGLEEAAPGLLPGNRPSSGKYRLEIREASGEPLRILPRDPYRTTLYTWTREVKEPFTEEMLNDFWEKVKKEEIWRVKGLVSMADGSVRKLDYAFGDVFEKDTESADASVLNRIVFIGKKVSMHDPLI